MTSAVLLAIPLALWALGFLFLWRVPVLAATAPAADAPPRPSVSVVIPARNEERSLPVLLDSLQKQDPAPTEIIVVDDHSEDRTAGLARAAGVNVLAAEALPDGWLGKSWACWQGARAAGGEVLVFLDADTALEPGALRRLLASHRRDGGLLSVWPYHRMLRPYERLSALFNVVILASMRCFTIWSRRREPLGAFGPCVVCSRRDYFAVGGHRAVRGTVLEDVALGRLFREAGHGLHNYGGRGSVRFRMYPDGPGALVTGFGKNLGAGAGSASPAILLLLIGWIAGAFSAWLACAAGAPTAFPWIAPCALYALYALQIHWMLHRLGNYGLCTAVLFPVPLLFFAAVFLVSLGRTYLLRRVRWKGRSITMGRR